LEAQDNLPKTNIVQSFVIKNIHTITIFNELMKAQHGIVRLQIECHQQNNRIKFQTSGTLPPLQYRKLWVKGRPKKNSSYDQEIPHESEKVDVF
jgi:hypothetical protein